MEEVLKKILIDNDSFDGYDSDYMLKFNNQIYNKIYLSEQKSLDEVCKSLQENNDTDMIIELISSFDKKYLFNSYLHGYMHNERVLFFSYLISKSENINDIDLEIIMDAAKYHDIGRQNDFADTAHGLVAANKLDFVIGRKEIYKNKENLDMLKFIVDYHSVQDNLFDVIAENHNIKDLNRARKLACILKDADALDRVRLSMGRNSSHLDPSFLRLEESKSLVRVAHQLNEVYLCYLRAREADKELDNLANACNGNLYFHGVGVDFFKLESILEHGIMSANMLNNNNIKFIRNYNGFNANDFISVACYGSKYYSNVTAFDVHIKEKMSLAITDIYPFEAVHASEFNRAEMYKNTPIIPIDRGVYSDERFVKDGIPLSCIKSVIISRSLLKEDVASLHYMCNGPETNIVINKIKYFIDIIESKSSIQVDREPFKECIKSIHQLNEEHDINSTKDKVMKYSINIRRQFDKIDRLIGHYISQVYQLKLGKKFINVQDVLADILEKKGISMSVSNDGGYAIIDVGILSKKEKSI